VLAHIITDLQSFGLQVSNNNHRRKGGAGPSEGGTVSIGKVPVFLPSCSRLDSGSIYTLSQLEDGEFLLLQNGKPICPVTNIPRPKFYDRCTEDGTPCSRIALLHGKDCLASTVIQTCVNWRDQNRCHFCGIELSLQNGQTTRVKTPAQLADAASWAKDLDNVGHVVLTSGASPSKGEEISHLARCAKAIKEATNLPIHAQFLPPEQLDSLYELKEAGVDTAGIHIESFDPEVLALKAPVKAALGLSRYEKAWRMAVDVFGPNQVSSFLIAGLGEEEQSIIEGSRLMAGIGVYPFLVPLRPVPGTLMEDAPRPDPKVMKRLYEAVLGIVQQNDLSSSRSLAGCVRCGACSALGSYEKETKKDVICRSAENEAEKAIAIEIRREVFVEEQGMFEDSDFDANDAKSIHLVVETNGLIVGTVRVFPENGSSGQWVGGRLAVKKQHRTYKAGKLLVQEAMRCVKRHGCTRFIADIQQQNVAYFSRLGWNAIGPVKMHYGRPHQLMEADLERV
jgi:radical SAM protein (TIGR04043 family)/putative N-acetyltransferase (TIGR04045 family)